MVAPASSASVRLSRVKCHIEFPRRCPRPRGRPRPQELACKIWKICTIYTICMVCHAQFSSRVLLPGFGAVHVSHRNPRHQRLFISCSKSSTSISGKCACPSRGTQNDTRESVTEILLKLPETEAFDGMPEATVRLFQASIARFSNQSEAKLIVQALGNWRSALERYFASIRKLAS